MPRCSAEGTTPSQRRLGGERRRPIVALPSVCSAGAPLLAAPARAAFSADGSERCLGMIACCCWVRERAALVGALVWCALVGALV